MSRFRRRQMLAAAGGGENDYIVFADPAVEAICVQNWGDGIGITPAQAAAVTSIGTVFKGNTQITSFDEFQFFTGVTQLGEAFNNCSNLSRITLPPNLQTIGSYCFYGALITDITLPASISTVDLAAFFRGPLERMVCLSTTPFTIRLFGWSDYPSLQSIYVPYSSDHSILNAYKAASPWDENASIIYELNPDGTIPT